MLPLLLTDENFNGIIVRGIERELPAIDIVRVQDVDLSSTDDRKILSWAAKERRVLLTHDIKTMRAYADERLMLGLPLAGVIVVPSSLPIGSAIYEIHLLLECTPEDEWENRVYFVPI